MPSLTREEVKFLQDAKKLLAEGWRASGTGGLIQHQQYPARKVLLGVAVAMRRIQDERPKPVGTWPFLSKYVGPNDGAWDYDLLSAPVDPSVAVRWAGEKLLLSKQLAEDFEAYRASFLRSKDWDEEFTGKSRPGDWRPRGAETCHICNGTGVTAESRTCTRCGGRGHLSKGK